MESLNVLIHLVGRIGKVIGDREYIWKQCRTLAEAISSVASRENRRL